MKRSVPANEMGALLQQAVKAPWELSIKKKDIYLPVPSFIALGATKNQAAVSAAFLFSSLPG